MAFRNHFLEKLTGRRVLIACAISAATFTCVARGQTIFSTDDGIISTDQQAPAPVRSTRLNQQPRPESAPSGSDGHAVELTGDIDSWPLPRQPRPTSAVPTHLEKLVQSL